MSDLSWLNPTPHAIAVYASQPTSPLTTQHSLPSGRYSLLGPDFHRLDRTSFAWRTHSITSSVRVSSVGGPPEHIRKVWSVGHQTPRFDVVPRSVHRRQPLAQRRDVDSDAVGICERVGAHIKRVRAALECLEGGREILRLPDFQ